MFTFVMLLTDIPGVISPHKTEIPYGMFSSLWALSFLFIILSVICAQFLRRLNKSVLGNSFFFLYYAKDNPRGTNTPAFYSSWPRGDFYPKVFPIANKQNRENCIR